MLEYYNKKHPHSGQFCYEKTPYQTFIDSIKLAKDKQLTEQFGTADTVANAPFLGSNWGDLAIGADG